jgi:hypothetical protein
MKSQVNRRHANAGAIYCSGVTTAMGVRSQRQILEATIAASLLSAAPSVLFTLQRDGVGGAWRYGVRATRAIGTLVPPGRPNVVAGTVTHVMISAAFGQVLGRLLPRQHSVLSGAAAGAVMGVLGAGVVGRRFAALRALPFGPQLADNVAFGMIFAAVVDRERWSTRDAPGVRLELTTRRDRRTIFSILRLRIAHQRSCESGKGVGPKS